MNKLTTFNGWLLSKILGFLSTHQGFITEESIYTSKGIQATVRDVFGHRYQINIKTLSRTVDHIQPNEGLAHAKESTSVVFTENSKTFIG